MNSMDCIAFTLGPITRVKASTTTVWCIASWISGEALCGKLIATYRRIAASSDSSPGAGSMPATLPRSPRQIVAASAQSLDTSLRDSASLSTM